MDNYINLKYPKTFSGSFTITFDLMSLIKSNSRYPIISGVLPSENCIGIDKTSSTIRAFAYIGTSVSANIVTLYIPEITSWTTVSFDYNHNTGMGVID